MYNGSTYNGAGFAYTTNGGSTMNVYSNTGIMGVAMSGDGNKWLTVGTSGILYSKTKFSGGTLLKGPNTVKDLNMIIIPSSANFYFAFSKNKIYKGTINF
jgi:hypothetical protein